MEAIWIVVVFGLLIALCDSTAQFCLKTSSINKNKIFVSLAIALYIAVAWLLYTSYKKVPSGFSTVNLIWVATSALIVSGYGLVLFKEQCHTKTIIATLLVVCGVLLKISCFAKINNF